MITQSYFENKIPVEMNIYATSNSYDTAYPQKSIPLDNLVINADTRNLQLTFDLAALYREPTPIDFNSWNNNQSLTTQEYPWLDAMRYNFSSSFSISIQ